LKVFVPLSFIFSLLGVEITVIAFQNSVLIINYAIINSIMISSFSGHVLENFRMNRSHCHFSMLNDLKLSNLDICVDGTTNFAHGYPSFAVSVGVLFQGNPAAASVVLIELNLFL
jgi:hypothetical protein